MVCVPLENVLQQCFYSRNSKKNERGRDFMLPLTVCVVTYSSMAWLAESPTKQA